VIALVGDDVVDLDDPAVARTHPRFADRITSPEERVMLAHVPPGERTLLLWSLFAAKEAAFKVTAKLAASPVFAHASYVVAPDFASVRWESRDLALGVVRGDGFVHAVATTGPRPVAAAISRLRGGDASREARQLLARELAPSLGVAAERVAVVREPRPGSWDGFGPPRLVVGGEPSALDISLSHDGRFVSFAAIGPQLASLA
jgi:4'-phosphopantetheinyl transferase superfamily